MHAGKFVIYTQTPKAIGEKIWKNIDDISNDCKEVNTLQNRSKSCSKFDVRFELICIKTCSRNDAKM